MNRFRDGAGTRFLVLAAATAVLAVALLTAAAGRIVYQERARHENARTPVVVEEGGPGRFLWSVRADTLNDHLQHMLFLVVPTSPDAPVPPGLPRWPRPGEAFLSPQLLRDGASEGIARRYGELAGTIGQEGLGVPDERLAYVRPRGDRMPPNTTAARGYLGRASASDTPDGLGESMMISGQGTFLRCALWLLVLPATVLLLVAGAFCVTDRRRAPARGSGAVGGREPAGTAGPAGTGPTGTAGESGTRGRAVTAVPAPRGTFPLEVLAPVLTGLAVAAAGLLAAVLAGPRLPVTGFVVPGEHLAAHPLPLGAALGVAGATAIAVPVALGAVARRRPARRRRRSRRPGPAPLAGTRAMAFPVALFVAVRLPDVLDPNHDRLWTLTYRIGVAAALVTLPISLAVLVPGIGSTVAALGRRTGSPRTVVAGRLMTIRPAGTACAMGTGLVLIGVLLHAGLWASRLGPYTAQALSDQRDHGLSTVTVHLDDGTRDVSGLLRELPGDLRTVRVDSDLEAGTTTITGDCVSLRPLGLPCGGRAATAELPDRSRALLGYAGVPQSTTLRTSVASLLEPGRFPADGGVLLIERPSGERIDLPPLKEIANRTLGGIPVLGHLGEDRIGSDLGQARQAVWVALFGIGTTAIGGTAVGILVIGRFRARAARRGTGAGAGQAGALRAVGAWTVAIPLAVAAWAAPVVGWFLEAPVTDALEDPDPSLALRTVAPAVLSLVALAVWGWLGTREGRPPPGASAGTSSGTGTCSRAGSVVEPMTPSVSCMRTVINVKESEERGIP